MKAFLLAAGRGTRLSPLTDSTPKCLIPINGKPLLRLWLDHLSAHHIQEVLINTHHHAHQVDAFVQSYAHSSDIRIVLYHEPELLGSAGTILNCREFVDSEDDFMIFYADNLTNINLKRFASYHQDCRKKNGVLTMGLFHSPNPASCGIAELDSNQRIVGFSEKPDNPRSNLANAGVYMASQEIFAFFPETPLIPGAVLDFGHHILPLLIGKMYGYPITEYLRDIGTIESYQQALMECPDIAFQED